MSNRDKFQGVCLISSEGHRYMSCYDRMGPLARKRLQESPFNVCAACVLDTARRYGNQENQGNQISAITEMERDIRRMECTTFE